MVQPRVILGLMTYGPPSPDTRVSSLHEFRRHLDRFRALGYDEIDTARIYIGGAQERFTAEADWRARGLRVATKSYPLSAGGHAPSQVRCDLEQSLKDLKTASVDIFYLHHPDRSTPFQDTLAEVDRMYREGKFETFGLSNYSALEIAEVMMLCHQNAWVKPKIYQGVYNVLNRNLETEIIPACHRYGLDIVIYSPLCGGLLTGRYTSCTDAGDGRYRTAGHLGPIHREKYLHQTNLDAIQIIRAAIERHELSMTEVALRWCVHHSSLRTGGAGNDGVIIGASKLDQLENNIRDLEKGPLPEALVDELDKAWLLAKSASDQTWHSPLVYTYDACRSLFQ